MKLLGIRGGVQLLRQPLMSIRRHFSEHVDSAAAAAGHAGAGKLTERFVLTSTPTVCHSSFWSLLSSHR